MPVTGTNGATAAGSIGPGGATPAIVGATTRVAPGAPPRGTAAGVGTAGARAGSASGGPGTRPRAGPGCGLSGAAAVGRAAGVAERKLASMSSAVSEASGAGREVGRDAARERSVRGAGRWSAGSSRESRAAWISKSRPRGERRPLRCPGGSSSGCFLSSAMGSRGSMRAVSGTRG